MRDDASKTQRIHWMDNLRTFMIFLVIVIHAGLVYESTGIPAFFWIVDDPATNDLSGIVNLIVDVFVMSTIFFISGFLTPLSLKRKGRIAYLKSKFKRLMIPWLFSVLTLIPLYKVVFLYSRNLPQEHWTTYFHWTNGIWGQNWLWFLPVLFLFNVLYLLASKVNVAFSKLSLRKAVWIAFLIGFVYTLCMDLFGLQGWTKTLLVDFQNERILIYLLVFLLGSHCSKLKAFETSCRTKRLYVVLACISWIPINAYLFLVIYSLIKPGSYILSKFGDLLLIRGSFLLSLICLMYLAIYTFRYYINGSGRIRKELNSNSYYVYIIHTVVLGIIAMAMLNVTAPSVFKHFALVVLTFAVSNGVLSARRRLSLHSFRQGRGTMDGRLTRREI